MNKISKNLSLYLVGGILLAVTFSSQAMADDTTYDVVRHGDNDIVLTSTNGCVRTRWAVETDPCGSQKQAQAQPVPAPTAPAIASPTETHQVYFAFDSYAIAPAEQSKLNALAGEIKIDKTVQSISIGGHADRIGTLSYNDKLSQKRAETVANYLEGHITIPPAQILRRWYGKTAPLPTTISCSDSLSRADLIACLQPDRRADIEVHHAATATTGMPAD